MIFLAGRSIGGLAIGTMHFLIPLYINEIVPAHQKTSCHSMLQLQFVLGVLAQYVLSKCTLIEQIKKYWTHLFIPIHPLDFHHSKNRVLIGSINFLHLRHLTIFNYTMWTNRGGHKISIWFRKIKAIVARNVGAIYNILDLFMFCCRRWLLHSIWNFCTRNHGYWTNSFWK